jgi:hypothetical protein
MLEFLKEQDKKGYSENRLKMQRSKEMEQSP